MNRKIIAIVLIIVIGIVVFMIFKKKNTTSDDGITVNPATPDNISYSIINVYPHDTSSYTQGLIIYKGTMYEGTGLNGQSKLLKVDLKTGKAEKQVVLDSVYFGEGIVILNDTIYQLTWRNKKVFVYDLGFKKIKEFPLNTEGWGMTTDGTNLIVSDGSNNLYFYEPSTFKLLRTQSVTEGGGVAYNLNELEYIDGYVYANQYQLPYILKIDPSNGMVKAKTDLSDLWNRVKIKDPKSEVPNGIAYDSASKKIYITGKLWPELYEIQFSK
ncbi:MAG: glutaminyl-peptide cyclotransferase [Bacteroidota bacterium]|nr:glutaminyl-peptide cyclotransferase [Bacteroidota bacterium]